MKLLAIDTSTEKASVALLAEEIIYTEEQDDHKTHAQVVLSLVESLMNKVKLSIGELDAIVFGQGPGSFTGLRVACSLAKGLAYPHDLPVIPVSTLGAIAFAVREQEEYKKAAVLAVIDARMQQMYWNYFAPGFLVGEDRVGAVADIHLPDTNPLILAGVGIDAYWPAFPDRLKSQIITQTRVYPQAQTMIKLVKASQLRGISAASAEPVYVRNQVTQGEKGG